MRRAVFHYTAAFRYFEIAEWELMRQAGFPLSDHRKISGLPRVNVSATFYAPLFVDEPIEVKVWVERIGTTSITFGRGDPPSWRALRQWVDHRSFCESAGPASAHSRGHSPRSERCVTKAWELTEKNTLA